MQSEKDLPVNDIEVEEKSEIEVDVDEDNKFIETKKKYKLSLNDIMGEEIAWRMSTFERRLSEIAKKEGGYEPWFNSDEWDS